MTAMQTVRSRIFATRAHTRLLCTAQFFSSSLPMLYLDSDAAPRLSLRHALQYSAHSNIIDICILISLRDYTRA